MRKPKLPDFRTFVRPLTALLALVVIAFVAKLAFEAEKLPPPLDVSAAPDVFSAGRAKLELDRVAGSNVPRPVGSLEATRVHDAIEARLKALGYAVEEQNTLSCRGGMGCTNVRNVLTRNGTPDTRGMVLVVSHYDSVPAGPGAGDDGSGVAVALEVARALGSKPRAADDRVVGFLFDEAEEDGLFGATAFVEEHPWMKDVTAVVNLDARGTGGASMLFEVLGDTDAVAKIAADGFVHPSTSSLLAAVYALMPNDTDLSMFRNHVGITAANLAFVGGVTRYHTSHDTVDAMELPTLQSHGANALALVRGFAASSFQPEDAAPATFFDVLHQRVVRCDLLVTWIVSGLAVLFTLVAVVRRRTLAGRELATVGWTVFGLVLAGLVAFLVGLALEHLGALPAPFIADPKYLEVVFAAVAIGATCATATQASRNDHGYPREPDRASAIAWVLFALLGGAAAVLLPGAAYVFALPALAAGIVRTALPRSGHLAEVAGGAVLAVLVTPVVVLLYDALGFALPVAFALPLALFFLPIAPLFDTVARVVVALAALVLVVAGGLALRAPAFTVTDPQRVDVVYLRDATRAEGTLAVEAGWGGRAWGEVPRAMKDALGTPQTSGALVPWSSFLVPEAAVALSSKEPEPPVVDGKTEKVDGSVRTLHFHLTAPPHARSITLAVHDTAAVTDATVDGKNWPAAARGTAEASFRLFTLRAPPPKGVDVVLTISGLLPVEARLQATLPGLPPSAGPVLDARPLSAAPSQEGDRTIVGTSLTL